MGRAACTEPQCLYKGALYLYLFPFTYSISFEVNLTFLESPDVLIAGFLRSVMRYSPLWNVTQHLPVVKAQRFRVTSDR